MKRTYLDKNITNVASDYEYKLCICLIRKIKS